MLVTSGAEIQRSNVDLKQVEKEYNCLCIKRIKKGSYIKEVKHKGLYR